MIPLYDFVGFNVAWKWVHNVNSKGGGAYRPVPIDVRIRPESEKLSLFVRSIPELRRKVLNKVRRFAIGAIRRAIAMMRAKQCK